MKMNKREWVVALAQGIVCGAIVVTVGLGALLWIRCGGLEWLGL